MIITMLSDAMAMAMATAMRRSVVGGMESTRFTSMMVGRSWKEEEGIFL